MIPVVTVVSRDSVDAFLNTRSIQERTEHLRGLRALGVLVHNQGTLKQLVREPDTGWRGACYVFRGEAWSVPRIARKRRGSRVRVLPG